MKINNNEGLKLFLDKLSDQLVDAGHEENASLLSKASPNYIGSSSELLVEARISLSKILFKNNCGLTENDENDLRGAIQSIDIVFRKASGLI